MGPLLVDFDVIVPCNCSALRQAARDFVDRAGAPDLVIANAGISVGTLTQEASDLPVFERIMAVNVLGLVNTFGPFIAPMRRAGGGTLAGIASVAGIRGLPGSGAYSASKAAAITYLEALRGELRGSGIKVATVLPGYVETPMTAQLAFRGVMDGASAIEFRNETHIEWQRAQGAQGGLWPRAN